MGEHPSAKDTLNRIIALEAKVAGTQNNATNGASVAASAHTIASAALPGTGGTITGNLYVSGTVNWGGEAGANPPGPVSDFQGTWNGKSLGGTQLQFLSTLHQMSALSGYPLSTDGNSGSAWASGERGYINAIVNVLNSLISELISSNYLA
jgi:hypothetical protein